MSSDSYTMYEVGAHIEYGMDLWEITDASADAPKGVFIFCTQSFKEGVPPRTLQFEINFRDGWWAAWDGSQLRSVSKGLPRVFSKDTMFVKEPKAQVPQ